MLTQRYRAHHFPGQDCRVTCCRNVLDFHGNRYSYSDVQGLSSSFFFTYRTSWTEKDRLLMSDDLIPPVFWPVSGQRMDVMEALAYVFNASLVRAENQSADEAEAALERYVAQDLPVMVALSRDVLLRGLGVRRETPAWLGGLTFGGHWVVVTGLDPVARIATLYETDLAEPLQVPYALLREARSHGDDQPGCFMKSRNRWAVLLPPTAPPPLSHMMKTALGRTVRQMRHPVGHGTQDMGIAGLERFAAEFPGWQKHASVAREHLQATVHMMWLNSERLSGGGLGRRNFGMFLRRAAATLAAPQLGQAAACYAQAAEQWMALIGMATAVLDAGKEPAFDSAEAIDLLDGILRLEREGLDLVGSVLD